MRASPSKSVVTPTGVAKDSAGVVPVKRMFNALLLPVALIKFGFPTAEIKSLLALFFQLFNVVYPTLFINPNVSVAVLKL